MRKRTRPRRAYSVRIVHSWGGPVQPRPIHIDDAAARVTVDMSHGVIWCLHGLQQAVDHLAANGVRLPVRAFAAVATYREGGSHA